MYEPLHAQALAGKRKDKAWGTKHQLKNENTFDSSWHICAETIYQYIYSGKWKNSKEVDKRKIPGHWKGDSVVGKNHKSGLHTEYERVASFTRIEKMKRVGSDESIKAQVKIFSTLPPALRKSTTLDNGREHVKHKLLKDKLGMDTFFADPYASYQRNGNENANLWIRYYLPKKTDLMTIKKIFLQP